MKLISSPHQTITPHIQAVQYNPLNLERTRGVFNVTELLLSLATAAPKPAISALAFNFGPTQVTVPSTSDLAKIHTSFSSLTSLVVDWDTVMPWPVSDILDFISLFEDLIHLGLGPSGNVPLNRG